jgi:hypothetical protein
MDKSRKETEREECVRIGRFPYFSDSSTENLRIVGDARETSECADNNIRLVEDRSRR